MNELTTIEQRIEEKIDTQKAGALPVSGGGGMRFTSMTEVMEFAKLMSVAGEAVPPHLRGKPGTALAVCVQALEWNMSPFAVANKSYSVNGRVAYESQLIHAVIEQRAPIAGRMRHSYSGEGETRRCKVWVKVKGENDPFVYESPEFKDIQPKNSPLWRTKPDLQLFYNASRDLCRMYFPDVLLGIYAVDEIEPTGSVGFDNARDVSPSNGLMERLKAGGDPAEGFAVNQVDQETGGATTISEVATEAVTESAKANGEVEEDLEREAADLWRADNPDTSAFDCSEETKIKYRALAAKNRERANTEAKPEPKQPAKTEPAKDTAKPEPAKPVEATETAPKDDASYKEHAEAWIKTSTSITQIDQKWKGEKKLRADCKVTPDTLEHLSEVKSSRIDEIRKS